VTVNCAALHDGIFESELFGHKRGAFTGAFEDRIGLIEKASGGTLFLDEITELSKKQQAKLLRALEERKIRRLGESDERSIDIRLISATNRPVEELLESGELRSDLYFRIAADLIALKPLRERRADIRALFAYYIARNGNARTIEPEALDLLEEHRWPGNVRELVNLTKSMEGFTGRRMIRIGDLPRAIRHSLFSSGGVKVYDNGERRYIKSKLKNRKELVLSSLERNSGNKAAAARELGISRNTVYRYLKIG
jgi:transcriptional regulator with PAS, ATPase and Fis domain